MALNLHRATASAYCVILALVAAINYIPGLTDDSGVAFGIFALDAYDDALHAASAAWAGIAALAGRRASRLFCLLFGAAYLGDGLLGLATGSGYLDFGIFNYGVQPFPWLFKVLNNGPHVGLGGIALAAGLLRR